MDGKKYAVIDNEVCRYKGYGNQCFRVSPPVCQAVCKCDAVIKVGFDILQIVKVYCNGCGACKEVCLADAITMEVNGKEVGKLNA